MKKRILSALLLAAIFALAFPLHARADVIYDPFHEFLRFDYIGPIIISIITIVFFVIAMIVTRIPVKSKKNSATGIKPVLLGIVAFLIAQIIVDLILLPIAANAEPPFSNLAEDTVVSYFLLFGISFIPTFFFLGMLGSRIFKLFSKKSAAAALIGGFIILSAFWFAFIYLPDANYDFAFPYYILNMPATWAYNAIFNTQYEHAGLLNFANLFMTFLSPLAFALGILVNSARKRNRQRS